jgi:Xaa-Pro aminopeptidase
MADKSPSEFKARIAKARKRLALANAQALLVTHLPNIFYLSGFTGSSGALLVEQSSATLFTDTRYSIQAAEQAGGAGVKANIVRGALPVAIGAHLTARKRLTVVFDPTHATVSGLGALERASGNKVTWHSEAGWIEELRSVKSGAEIAKMRAAAKLASKAVEQVIKLIRPGMTEIDVAAEIEYRMRKMGAEGRSFDTIVASGARGALPHAQPTSKRLRRNELVVLDLGAILARYCSDLTRTVYLGKAPKRVREWYRAVREAQQAGIEALAAGATASGADAAARQVLAGHKLAQYFVHSTGHGLGLEVHEEPRLAAGQTRKLVAGNVVTVEPGIYIEGAGGIRIEDDVAIHSNRVEVLTTASRELMEL